MQQYLDLSAWRRHISECIPAYIRTRPDSANIPCPHSECPVSLPSEEDLWHHLKDIHSVEEASVLAQLRTGMARLNAYLHRIKAALTDQCACGQARETVEHFLFRCRRWTTHRTGMLQCTDTRRGNISFYLGRKSPTDDQNWTRT
jgi:hypothetical protein